MVDNASWVEIQRAGFHPRDKDPVVDLVAALHVRRLLSPPEGELEAALLAELDELLPALVSAAGTTREEVEAADAVTNVCDRIAFAFSFEEPASDGACGITYSLDGLGVVELDLWPLEVPELRGLILRSKRTVIRSGSFRRSCRSTYGHTELVSDTKSVRHPSAS